VEDCADDGGAGVGGDLAGRGVAQALAAHDAAVLHSARMMVEVMMMTVMVMRMLTAHVVPCVG
jgi:hypothetical protein